MVTDRKFKLGMPDIPGGSANELSIDTLVFLWWHHPSTPLNGECGYSLPQPKLLQHAIKRVRVVIIAGLTFAGNKAVTDSGLNREWDVTFRGP